MAVIGRCRLKQLLAQRGMSQIELSEITGKAESKISDYAKNKVLMSLSTAAIIAQALNCSIDDLYEFNLPESHKS